MDDKGKFPKKRREGALQPAVILSVAALLALFIPLLICGGCSAGSRRGVDSALVIDSIDSVASEEARRRSDMSYDARLYADSVVGAMSDEELVGMLFMPAIFSRADGANMRLVREYAKDLHVGGLVLLKGDLRSAAVIADSLRSFGGTGLFIAVDAENGLKMRFAEAPEFPWNRELGNISDEQLLFDFGREIARECRVIGVNMVLGPVMDVVPGNRSHGLMRKRSLGSDSKRVADLAIAYARGVETGNVISVAKHFPGHGSSNADSHKALGEIKRPRAAIDSIDLYPFRRYAEEGLSGVMVGHLAVAALDSLRRPAVVSPIVMQDLLRDKFGFRGLVITDALNMEGAMGVKGWEAIMAGADIVIAPTNTRAEIASALEALNSGRLGREELIDRCRRILFYKYLVNQWGEESVPADEVVERVNSAAPAMRDTIVSALRLSAGN